MKNQHTRRLIHCALLLVLTAALVILPVYATGEGAASGDIAGVVDGIWQDAVGQMKSICNGVVFPALSVVCGIAFVISMIVSIFNYRKHHTVEVAWPIALLIGLLICLTAPTWVWTLVGA